MSTRSRTAVSWLVAALAAAGAWGQSAPSSNYRIGPKDLVEIRVAEEAALDVERRVTDNGTVNLPLVGELSVSGLTEEQAAAGLKRALEESYLQRATVSVQVIEFRSRPISVLGAVNKPGNLELSGRWTLLEALTEAGGVATDHGSVVHILRRAENGLSDQLTVRLQDLLVRADPRVNIPIFANDVITVPVAAEVTIFLMGEFARAGSVNFKSTERVTLLTAIAQAGGLTERASNRISIKRLLADGTRQEMTFGYKSLLSGREPDPVLEDRDLILVKESFF